MAFRREQMLREEREQLAELREIKVQLTEKERMYRALIKWYVDAVKANSSQVTRTRQI
jgi:hypothetical protein